MSFFHSFSGTTKQRQINLSQSSSPASPYSNANENPAHSPSASSPSYPSSNLNPSTAQTLLQKAKREKSQRSQARIRASSALLIQRVWRGWRTRERLGRELELELELGLLSPATDVERGMDLDWARKRREGRVLFYLLRTNASASANANVLPRPEILRWVRGWAEGGSVLDPVQGQGEGSYLITLVRLLSRMIDVGISAGADPIILQTLLLTLSAEAYHTFASGFPEEELPFVRRRGEEVGWGYERVVRRWVVEKVVMREKNVGKGGDGWVGTIMKGVLGMSKENPSLKTLLTLLILPSTSYPHSLLSVTQIYPAFITEILTVPNVTTRIPLSSLRTFIPGLEIWGKLVPLLATLDSDHEQAGAGMEGLSEVGKTEILGNLGAIVVRSGMLRGRLEGEMSGWIRALEGLLKGMAESWGLWIERKGVWGDEDELGEGTADADDDDDEEEEEMSVGKKRLRDGRSVPKRVDRIAARARGKISTLTLTRLRLIFDREHLGLLVNKTIRSGSPGMTDDLTGLILTMLQAFRGSERWEQILEGVLESESGVDFQRKLWSGVEGRWRDNTRGTWDSLFGVSPTSRTDQIPTLQLLSTLYLQNLIALPDAEFFNQVRAVGGRSALNLDEVTELAGIWRDLAFWGYIAAVNNSVETAVTRKKEELRALMTQGVLAISARNARRKFLPDDFWIMTSQFDLAGFIEAVCKDEAQLEAGGDQMDTEEGLTEQEIENNVAPPWSRARRMLSKRQMAKISPRLGLLNNLPMTLPFAARVQILSEFINIDRRRLNIDRYTTRRNKVLQATIRRTHLSQDSFDALNKLGPALKGRIMIVFVDEFGAEEEGIDGGGLFKEWLTSLNKEVFDTDRGLWLATDQNELYPNPHSYAKESHSLDWYTFIGRMLGKALYEGVLIPTTFAGFFLAKWLGRQSYLDDLASLDNDLYKGLIALKDYAGDPEDLSLTFTLDEEDLGMMRSIDLKRNGSNIPVTRANRMEYIQTVCDYKLNRQIAPQCEAFFRGLSDMIDPKWLRMFDQHELQEVVGGADNPIDVDDLERNSNMEAKEETIIMFWKVVRTFNQEQLRALLKFVTSTSNPPLLGFKAMNPNFGIRLNGTSDPIDRLPTAAACMNLLKLPRYTSAQVLKTKLLQAINENAGFYMS